jgi:hypothetical protein
MEHEERNTSSDGALRADIVVFGDAAVGVAAAVQAARMGKSVILISPRGHLGGMTSSGLGFTDIGNTAILGGISREFYHRAYLHYQNEAAWAHQARDSFAAEGQGTPAFDEKTELASVFEPGVAERIFDQLVAEHDITVVQGQLNRGAGVEMDEKRIGRIELEDGRRIEGAMFVDASYEGDLIELAGVTFTVGRESNALYGESGNGITGALEKNQLPDGIDPYVVPGDSASGLLPGVKPTMGGGVGDGDRRLQSYCYRMVLTDAPANRVAIERPADYDESEYEILFRAIEAGQDDLFFKTSAIPNRKTDSNNASGISTDYIGMNYGEDWDWTTLSNSERERAAAQHRDWQLGLVWTLQNHPRVPAAIRERYSVWGLPADEFRDNNHWPYAIYVREGRRLVSDFVMTEQHCRRAEPIEDSIGLGAYTLDSHNAQRFVCDGMVKNEGDIQRSLGGAPYQISYRAIVPRAGECENLLVPWCLSATHIAFGSIRMEPVGMILGQSAGTAAALAIDAGVAVQGLEYEDLSRRLIADGQVLAAASAAGEVASTRLSVEDARPGWRLSLRLPDGEVEEISSSGLAHTTEPAPTGATGGTTLVWDDLKSPAAKGITVTMTGTPVEAGTAWRLEVKNTGSGALWEVTFPDFTAPILNQDTIVIPSVIGRVHPAAEPLSFRPILSYPSGLVSMQCSGFYGPSGGVYVGVHDPTGSRKDIEVVNSEGHMSVRWFWAVPGMGTLGTGWKTPGDVVIRTFSGDWFDLAQIYRSWVSREAGWWPGQGRSCRGDTPDWFADNPVWIMSNGPWPYDEPPIPIEEAVAKIKRFAAFMDDLPCAVHWYNWHEVPYDSNFPNYFPAKRGFAEGVREVQEAGVRVMPYLNAHVWDTAIPSFETEGRLGSVKAFDGSQPIKSYGGNDFAPMCPATELWQEKVKELVRRLAGPEFNVDGVYLDQVSAQAAMLCFDETHPHPAGGGNWWTTRGYWQMLDSIREELPHLVLTSESNSEPYANRIHGYLSWLCYREGDASIPLFHAVYGGTVQLFGRLYKRDSWKGQAMRTKTAQALVWGEQLGWIVPDVVDDPVDGPFLKRLARMRYAMSRYLARGRMMRPPTGADDGTTLSSSWVYTDDLWVTTPTVFSGAWERDDARSVVLVLVNADEVPHTVPVEFDPEAYHLPGDLQMREWMATDGPSSPAIVAPAAPIWSREIELPPLSACSVEFGELGAFGDDS